MPTLSPYLLLPFNQQRNSGNTPLHVAAYVGNLAAVHALIEQGAKLDGFNYLGATALHLAASRGYLEIIQVLNQHGATLHLQDRAGQSALHLAICVGHLAVVKQLLSYGLDPNIIDQYGDTSLHLAAYYGNSVMIKTLLEFNANINVRNHRQVTPLQLAATSGISDAVKALLTGRNLQINAADLEGNTALHQAVSVGNLDMVRALSAQGAKINVRNQQGISPLYLAISLRRIEMAQFLMIQGGDVNLGNYNGFTALHLAVVHNDLLGINRLIAQGAYVNSRDYNGLTPLHWAAHLGASDAARLLLQKHAEIDLSDDNQNTPLHLAAIEGNTRVLYLLVGQRAKIDMRNIAQNTPLHLASYRGDQDAIDFLLMHGADIYAVNNEQKTALSLAMDENKLDAACLLINFGIEITQDQGRAMLAQARLNEHRRLTQLLTLYLQRYQLPQDIEVNQEQSVHLISIHHSVSQLAIALKQCYATQDLTQAQDALMNWANTHLKLGHRALAAKRGIHRLMEIEFIEQRSQLSLQQALALIWLALNDPMAITQQRLTTAEILQRQQILVDYCYEIQRGYNLDETGKDDGLEDDPICLAGTFNKLMSTLEGGRHHAVQLYFVTAETVYLKLQALVNTAFTQLPLTQQTQYAKAWTPSAGIPENWLTELMPQLKRQLKAEFEPFRSQINAYDTVLTESLEALEWLNPPPAVQAKQAELNTLGAPVLTRFENTRQSINPFHLAVDAAMYEEAAFRVRP
jgi:ankyrin repeat protein